jgi:hypothetical protein
VTCFTKFRIGLHSNDLCGPMPGARIIVEVYKVTMTGKSLIGKDLEGSGHGVIEALFALRDWGKPHQTLVRTAGVPAGTRNRHLPNASHERYSSAYLHQV